METESWFDKLMPFSPQECRQDFYNDGLGEIVHGLILSTLAYSSLYFWPDPDTTAMLSFWASFLGLTIFPTFILGYVVKSIRRRLWFMCDGVKEYYAAIIEYGYSFWGCLITFLAPMGIITLYIFDLNWIGAGANPGVIHAGRGALFWGLLQGFNHRKWRYAVIGVLLQALAMFVHVLVPDYPFKQLSVLFLVAAIGLLYMGLFQLIRFLKKAVLVR